MTATSGGWVYYGFQFLFLYPKFQCEGILDGSPEYLKYCVPNYFCNNEQHLQNGDKVINWSVD